MQVDIHHLLDPSQRTSHIIVHNFICFFRLPSSQQHDGISHSPSLRCIEPCQIQDPSLLSYTQLDLAAAWNYVKMHGTLCYATPLRCKLHAFVPSHVFLSCNGHIMIISYIYLRRTKAVYIHALLPLNNEHHNLSFQHVRITSINISVCCCLPRRSAGNARQAAPPI